MACLTSLALCIAAFTSSLEESDLQKAMESVKMNDVKNRSDLNIGVNNSCKKKKKTQHHQHCPASHRACI